MSNSSLSNNSKTTEANLTKLHRKIAYNEKVCRAQELGSYAQDQGGSEVKLCLNSCCSYTTEANLTKLYRKIKHNEKMCIAHEFGSYAQGQGCNQVSGQNRVSERTQKLLNQI